MGATIVVLGGGVGGIVAASRLRKALAAEHRVMIIDREPEHLFAPSLVWVMTGERAARSIRRPLRALRQRGVEPRQVAVEAVDVERRQVKAGGESIPYDYLVVALGSPMRPEALPGLAETQTYYTPEGAERLREALRSFEGGRVALVIAGLPYRCPTAPFEGILAIDGLLRSRGLRERSELVLFTPEPQPVPVAGAAAGEAVAGLLRRRGIEFRGRHKLISIAPGHLEFEGGVTESYDLLITIPPHGPSPALAGSGIDGQGGWVWPDRLTLATAAPHTYALGDATSIALFDGLNLPKAGVFAHAQAEVVAHNIALDLGARGSQRVFDGRGSCFLETGDGRSAFVTGDFYAEPRRIAMRGPGVRYHWQKIAFEKLWLWRWFRGGL